VLAAARSAFEERGWQGTTMRRIAAQAGVAVETVYAMVGSKAQILIRLVEVAVVGDDDPVPLRERPEYARITKGSRAARARATAELIWDVNSRIGGLERAVLQGAAVDKACAELQAKSRAAQLRGVREAFEHMGVPSPTDEQVAGALAVTCSEVFLLLTKEVGMDRTAYVDWLAATLAEHLTRGGRRASGG
jgi:AcrR family transcriptional regulator